LAQCQPNPGSAITAFRLSMDSPDMHQQRCLVEVATRALSPLSGYMLVMASCADPQHPALHRNRPLRSMLMDKGVPQVNPLAKYAVAFPSYHAPS